MIGQVVRTFREKTPWAANRPRRTGTQATRPERELQARGDRVRFHLGRGRRARDAGRYEQGVREAKRALLENAGNPWAYALLGQCLFRQAEPDLAGARLALERACALDPTNGYFVRLLLEVLDAQGDREHCENVLAWAWWSGAPVERWLGPAGPRHQGTTPMDGAPIEATAPGADRLAAPAATRATA